MVKPMPFTYQSGFAGPSTFSRAKSLIPRLSTALTPAPAPAPKNSFHSKTMSLMMFQESPDQDQVIACAQHFVPSQACDVCRFCCLDCHCIRFEQGIAFMNHFKSICLLAPLDGGRTVNTMPGDLCVQDALSLQHKH